MQQNSLRNGIYDISLYMNTYTMLLGTLKQVQSSESAIKICIWGFALGDGEEKIETTASYRVS